MVKTLSWGSHADELQLLCDDIVDIKFLTIDDIRKRLELILGPEEKVHGVDLRYIALLEFLFTKSQGPYSPYFLKYSRLIQLIVNRSGALKNMLNNTGAHAIGNMILNGRGKLKFTISDFYELGYVLDFWESCGLEKQTPRTVFRAILTKKGILERIQKKEPEILIRLSNVFPMFEKEIMPGNFDWISLSASPHNPFNKYYDSIIQYHIQQGLSLEDIIQLENFRQRNPVVKRNHFLSYLVKKHQNFQCQICNAGDRVNDPFNIQVHHIIPLSVKGEDYSSNMLVTCGSHHKEIHGGIIKIEKGERITINCDGKTFFSEPN